MCGVVDNCASLARFMLPEMEMLSCCFMLIKIKILRQEINLNRDYSHSVTSEQSEMLGNIHYHVI